MDGKTALDIALKTKSTKSSKDSIFEQELSDTENYARIA